MPVNNFEMRDSSIGQSYFYYSLRFVTEDSGEFIQLSIDDTCFFLNYEDHYLVP